MVIRLSGYVYGVGRYPKASNGGGYEGPYFFVGVFYALRGQDSQLFLALGGLLRRDVAGRRIDYKNIFIGGGGITSNFRTFCSANYLKDTSANVRYERATNVFLI